MVIMKMHFKKLTLVLIIQLCIVSPYYGQQSLMNNVDIIDSNVIARYLQLGLRFIEINQITNAVDSTAFNGEWPTTMGLDRPFLYLGKKERYQDANCFAVASIHNTLADIYLKNPNYVNIPNTLQLAYPRILSYKNNNRFNFWNALPPYRNHARHDTFTIKPLVRRPTNFPLRSRFINKAANIPEDADDTSLGYAAECFHQKILGLHDTSNITNNAIPALFDTYIDSNRRNMHLYNFINGNDCRTGAYLTWHAKEPAFKVHSTLKEFIQNILFFIPGSMAHPYAYKPYLPYGCNDLDAVVNCNVLYCLSINNVLPYAASANNAIAFIEKKAKRKKYDRAGVYYPNRYHFPYAVAKAYASDITALKNSAYYILSFLLRTQKKDGSWHAMKKLNKKDILQSTIYAVHALINIGNIEGNHSKNAIENGLRYILKHSIFEKDYCYWKGGVFFSGGTVIRSILTWKSDAYTTAIFLQALSNYKNLISLHN